MGIQLRFRCPGCGFVFPLLAHLSRYGVHKSFFSSYRYQCPNCGLVSRQAILWPNALWAWPLGTAWMVLIIFLFRTLPFFRDLYDSHEAIYGTLGGLLTFPFFFGLRVGLKLVPAPPEEEAKRKARGRAIAFAAVVVVCVLGGGILLGEWIGSLVLAATGIVTLSLFYLFSQIVRAKHEEK